MKNKYFDHHDYHINEGKGEEVTQVEQQVEELRAGATVSEEWVHAVEPTQDEEPALQRLLRLVVPGDTEMGSVRSFG